MRWCILLLCTGCMLGSKNQEGLQLTLNDLTQARTELQETAKGVAAVVKELNTAIQQERPPVVAPLLTAVTTNLIAAVDSLDEAGKTATTLQAGIGTPKPGVNLNFTKAQKDAWRAQYTAMAAAFDKLKSWLKSKSPVPIPGSTLTAAPKPWSGADIATLLGAITTGAAALGLGGKKVNTWRKGAGEAEGLAGVLKSKCNGDGEFTTTMQQYPTTVKRHRVGKVNEI